MRCGIKPRPAAALQRRLDSAALNSAQRHALEAAADAARAALQAAEVAVRAVDVARRRRKAMAALESWREAEHHAVAARAAAEDLRRRQEEQERENRLGHNRDRVNYRQEMRETAAKAAQAAQALRIAQREVAARRLEALAASTPYAERLRELARTSDLDRLYADTTATAAMAAAAESGTSEEEKAQRLNGYTTKQLFSDARFRLGMYLRDAGVHGTDAARRAVAAYRPAAPGSYRQPHHFRPAPFFTALPAHVACQMPAVHT